MKSLFRIGLSSLVMILTLVLPGFQSPANAQAVDDFVWAGHFGSGGEGTAVSKIRKSTNSVVATIDDVFNAKWGVAVDQDAVWVTNTLETGKVTRISKSTSSVVATITVGAFPTGIAVDQDSVWVANVNDGTVSRIRKSDNTVIATIGVGGVGSSPHGVAVDQDFVWVHSGTSGTVSKIRKSDNAVVATIEGLGGGVGITVDQDSAWVTHQFTAKVSRISKNTNTIAATIDLPSRGYGITVDEDFVWVAHPDINAASKIRKSDNTLVATIDIGGSPRGISIDQESVWVFGFTTSSTGRVSRINKSTSEVTSIIVGNGFANIGDATGFAFDLFFGTVPFTAFDAKAEVALGPLANDDSFEVKSTFTLGTGSDGIDPLTEDVSLQVGTFSTTIPAGSFKFHPANSGKGKGKGAPARWTFEGVIDGVELEAKITDLGGGSFEFKAEGENADLTGTVNPVDVALTIGDDSGSTTVEAEFE